LTGRTFDQEGLPIAGVQVIYHERNSSNTVSATDHLCEFHSRGLPSHKIMISLTKKGYKCATGIIQPAAPEIEVTLPPQPAAQD
jgi:hypothetical protein